MPFYNESSGEKPPPIPKVSELDDKDQVAWNAAMSEVKKSDGSYVVTSGWQDSSADDHAYDRRPKKPISHTEALMQYDAEKKSLAVAYVLWFLLGTLGFHRLYLGRSSGGSMFLIYVGSWLMLLLFPPVGVLGFIFILVWWLMDALTIPVIVQGCNEKLRRKLL